MEKTKVNFFGETEKVETETERKQRIITECKESENVKKWYLTQNGVKSIEKIFSKEVYWNLHINAVRQKEEKQKIFKNKEIKYLVDLLKKLKKIFNKAIKEFDIDQLKYLKKKLWKVCGDTQLKNNNISKEYYDLQFKVNKKLRELGV